MGPAAGPDDVRTDIDAMHAASMARTDRRDNVPAPAWQRFGSQPATGRHGLPPDDPDLVVPLSAARSAGDDAMMGVTSRHGEQRRVWSGRQREWVTVPDGGLYGTGKAYNPAAMR